MKMNELDTYNTRVDTYGHRGFVGGTDAEKWYNGGKMQYHFLVSQGLQPDHTFLDVACGSLRLGQWLIPMLDSGNYYGIDGNAKLVQRGIEQEFMYDVLSVKRPNFAYNYDFNLDFIDSFDFAIAQSLLTHMTTELVDMCLGNLSQKMHQSSKLYITYFQGTEKHNPVTKSDPQKVWRYRFSTIQNIANRHGLALHKMGKYNSPNPQMLLLAEKI